jgi:hypothetical protein
MKSQAFLFTVIFSNSTILLPYIRRLIYTLRKSEFLLSKPIKHKFSEQSPSIVHYSTILRLYFGT